MHPGNIVINTSGVPKAIFKHHDNEQTKNDVKAAVMIN